jgi:hypothetical protein
MDNLEKLDRFATDDAIEIDNAWRLVGTVGTDSQIR